jgi:hypothetical protein
LPPDSARARDPEDTVALAAVVCGLGMVLVGWREPATLAAGCGIGVGGVLLALRTRPVEARPPERSLAGVVLVVVVLIQIARFAFGYVTDWLVGQLLSEDAGPRELAMRTQVVERVASTLRIAAPVGAVIFLLLALRRFLRVR